MTRRDLAGSLRPVHGQKDPRFPSHGAIAPQGEFGTHEGISLPLVLLLTIIIHSAISEAYQECESLAQATGE